MFVLRRTRFAYEVSIINTWHLLSFQVRSIALPVYENTSETHTLRIAAFRVFLSTRPDLYLLRYVAEEIIDEPSDQVTFYVVSLFRALAESEYPCHAEM